MRYPRPPKWFVTVLASKPTRSTIRRPMVPRLALSLVSPLLQTARGNPVAPDIPVGCLYSSLTSRQPSSSRPKSRMARLASTTPNSPAI